jgi:hypothetical protein
MIHIIDQTIIFWVQAHIVTPALTPWMILLTKAWGKRRGMDSGRAHTSVLKKIQKRRYGGLYITLPDAADRR